MPKALTIHQPWASLVAVGAKTIETRSWPTKHRGRLLIHAAKADLPADCGALLSAWARRTDTNAMPYGAIIASCTLADCVPTVDVALWDEEPPRAVMVAGDGALLFSHDDQAKRDAGEDFDVITDQLPFGDFAPGRWAWLLEDVQPTTERCPACWGRGGERHPLGARLTTCPVCDAAGKCGPIPAKGRQGLWEWTP